MEWVGLVLIVVLVTGFDFTNGVHDAANAVASAVSTKALSPRGALALAAVMNLIGALAGTAVAVTVASGIIDTPHSGHGLIVVGAALVGAISWNITTWYFGLPSSSSHALVGGLVGAALASATSVHRTGVLAKVVIPMILSPLVGLGLGYLVIIGLRWAFTGRTRTARVGCSGARRSCRPPASRSATACRTRRRAWA